MDGWMDGWMDYSNHRPLKYTLANREKESEKDFVDLTNIIKIEILDEI